MLSGIGAGVVVGVWSERVGIPVEVSIAGLPCVRRGSDRQGLSSVLPSTCRFTLGDECQTSLGMVR